MTTTALEPAVLVDVPVTACPRCRGVMGDGDRVTAGMCGCCRHRARQARRPGALRPAR